MHILYWAWAITDIEQWIIRGIICIKADSTGFVCITCNAHSPTIHQIVGLFHTVHIALSHLDFLVFIIKSTVFENFNARSTNRFYMHCVFDNFIFKVFLHFFAVKWSQLFEIQLYSTYFYSISFLDFTFFIIGYHLPNRASSFSLRNFKMYFIWETRGWVELKKVVSRIFK